MSNQRICLPDIQDDKCIIFIGMAGAGKTTVGRMVAQALNWAFADSDHIIEATYATELQNLADALSKQEFIDVEAKIVQKINLKRTVLATGGSVIYREDTMKHLASLGPIVYLDVPMEDILERISHNPDRGLAIEPGQTIKELFEEREALYKQYADIVVPTSGLTPVESAHAVLKALSEYVFA